MSKTERERAEILKARQAMYGYGDERDKRKQMTDFDEWMKVNPKTRKLANDAVLAFVALAFLLGVVCGAGVMYLVLR